jgi:DNA modification methylase
MGVCLIILKDIPDDSIGAFITDPPYEINFMLRLGIKLEFPIILISGINFFVFLSQGLFSMNVSKAL